MERRIVSASILVAIVAVVVQTVVHVANAAFWDLEALNADEEHNAFAWASSMSTFAAGFFIFLPVAAAPVLGRLSLALSAAITFFSFDDALSVHERLSERSVDLLDAQVSLERIVWPVVYLPALAFVFVMLWRMGNSTAIRVGLGLLAAAILAELSSALYVDDGDVGSWPDVLEVTLEEGAELAGWILVAGALAARAYALADRRT